MHKSHLELQHQHIFLSDNRHSGRKITAVIIINAFVMVAEIAAGMIFGSMALTADGWHMGTHILALGISLLAYHFASKYMQDARFAFGTWKIEILGSYTSAILLGVAGVSMCFAAVERLIKPVPIQYDHALIVAVAGLVVNIIGAFILGGNDSHHHDHQKHSHKHEHDHAPGAHTRHHLHDLNMRAAYIHILTDALTSVFAIAALACAKYFGWVFIDPVAGIVGGILILRWTVGLLKASGGILLDREDAAVLTGPVRETIESDGCSKVSDLHIWQIASNKYACIIVLATIKNRYTIADFKQRLSAFKNIVHVSIEMHYLAP